MRRTNISNYSDYLIWWIVSLWLIVDSITGFFLSKGINVPISQLYKLTVLFLVLWALSKQKSSLILVFVILTWAAIYFLHLNINGYPYLNAFLSLSKFLTAVFLYLYFCLTIRVFKEYSIHYGYQSLILGAGVVIVNVLLGVLGFGVPSYGGDEIDMGVKGFFFAGNELGGIMAVMAPFLFYLILLNLSGIKYYCCYIVILAAGILIGTKTSILATVSAAVIIPYLYLSKQSRRKFIFAWLIILICLISLVIKYINELEIGAIERWTFFYETGGLEKLIFSGRDEFWDNQKSEFFNASFLSQLFGMGSDGKIIERDHLDTLLIYGYVGFCLIAGFYLYLTFYAIKHRHNNSLGKVIVFSDILILGIAYMAGHVWFSAMASVYIALLNSFSTLRYKGILFGKNINNLSQ
ncbi:O-antigen ligase family protein [Heminiphilus faecis]|uniref:O-antigen ligase family protein n=1 Tax=Heminiphilus faecis TaxID=2601703 RepID=A0ABV4CRU1_9BACT